MPPEDEQRPLCPDCHQEIDPDWCWCGSKIVDNVVHSDNHSAVPMGCICSFSYMCFEEGCPQYGTPHGHAKVGDETQEMLSLTPDQVKERQR